MQPLAQPSPKPYHTSKQLPMHTQLKAIIFDVDGTIADTERYGHLPAANDAMRELGLDITWHWDTFKDWINTIPGNVNRLKYSLKKEGYTQQKIERLAEAFAPLKKSIYINKYLPNLQLREGVVPLIRQTISEGVRLAIVSTSYESQIKALLQSQLAEFYKYFDPILGKESGRKTENDGFLHKKCLDILNIKPPEAIVIEDSQNGLDAAICADIPTVVFYNDYTVGSPFEGAKLIAPNMAGYTLEKLIEHCFKVDNFSKVVNF
ncbi:MAG TPA: phosphatase [Bacteroidetes bacterium]|nr:phosphatase [Bacteroidota bacterium]